MGAADDRSVNVVILAAGMGTRLGRPHPKPLTTLRDGRTILRQQLDHISGAFADDARVSIVVGFKKRRLLEAAASEASFVFNEEFSRTNTSKSLLRALRMAAPGGVLWMNGDVVFDPEALKRAARLVRDDQSFVTVNTSKVSDEEVKYTTDAEGYIAELSKQVKGGLGEAVGINYVSKADKATLVHHLSKVDNQDYFERGIELAIGQDGLRFEPVDISDLYAVEVDFAEDLERANLFV